MPRMKMLKSIAHNVAHSYLSLMNYIDGEYTVERLFKIAKKSKETKVEINILEQFIEPKVYVVPEIEKSLHYLEMMFYNLINAEDIKRDQIISAIITIEFDLEKTQMSKAVSELELPKYKCISEIVDSTGKIHKKEVVEWWKY